MYIRHMWTFLLCLSFNGNIVLTNFYIHVCCVAYLCNCILKWWKIPSGIVGFIEHLSHFTVLCLVNAATDAHG